MNQKRLLNLLACGLAGTTASIANAGSSTVSERPVVVNISGATLMENFVRGFASTNDFLDLDRDGIVVNSITDENLAEFQPAAAYNPDLWFVVQYRATGSVNGFQELLDFGTGFATGADTGDITNTAIVFNTPPNGLSHDLSTTGYCNGVNGQYLVAATAPQVGATPGGVFMAGFNASHPGGVPVKSYGAVVPPAGKNQNSAPPYIGGGVAMLGGYRQDLAPLDVPSRWASTTAGTPNVVDAPGDPGYGLNTRQPVDKLGNPIAFSFQLVTVPNTFDFFSGGPSTQNTIFDTPLAYAPVGTLTNYGTNLRAIRYTTMRHMTTTGRTDCGENLMQINRSPGSGTHNAYCNSICIDPSFGVGEAIGGENVNRLLGPGFLPSNKIGSSDMEGALREHRLGIGYSGAERGIASTWLTDSRIECLAVRADLPGATGTAYARPTILNVLGFSSVDTTFPYTVPAVALSNRYNGYNIGGPGIMATLGDPRSGLNTVSINGASVTALGTDALNANANMRNGYAAEYINNITRAVDAFAIDPSTLANRFTPGEFLAQTLIIAGARNVQQIGTAPCTLLVNGEPGFITPVGLPAAGFTAASNTLANARYQQFGHDNDALNEPGEFNGRSSAREVLTGTNRYSDGRGTAAPNNVYVRQSGATLAYGNVALGNRNRVSGDFNGDGHRDCADAEQMIRAWVDRNFARDNAGAVSLVANVWTAPAGNGLLTFFTDSSSFAGDQACIELLGDFNGDGNFGRIWNNGSAFFAADYSDALYWADGLGVVPVLDPSTPGANAPYAGVGDPRLTNFDDSDNPFVAHNRKMNRMKAFMNIDTAWETVRTGAALNLSTPPTGFVSLPNNFFGVSLVRGTYNAGDACADVTGSGRRTVGFSPIGGDGIVNLADIEFVRAQFLRNPNVTDGALNWSNLAEAQHVVNLGGEVCGDFTCDINGDQIIDRNDAIKILTILETTSCDINLDGVVDGLDQTIIMMNQGITSGALFSQGDADLDGDVDAADLAFCFVPVCCVGNADKVAPGAVAFADVTAVLANFGGPANPNGSSVGDADCNGAINFADITAVLANFNSPCP